MNGVSRSVFPLGLRNHREEGWILHPFLVIEEE